MAPFHGAHHNSCNIFLVGACVIQRAHIYWYFRFFVMIFWTVPYAKAGTQCEPNLRTKSAYVWMGLRTCAVPSANSSHTIRCKHALRYLWTVCIPFIANENMLVFCANTKGIVCAMYTSFCMFASCMFN